MIVWVCNLGENSDVVTTYQILSISTYMYFVAYKRSRCLEMGALKKGQNTCAHVFTFQFYTVHDISIINFLDLNNW